MQGQIQSAMLAQSRSGNQFSKVTLNGQRFNVFDNGQLAQMGPGAFVQYDTVQNGQYLNMTTYTCNGRQWTDQRVGGGAPRSNGGRVVVATQAAPAGKSREELILGFSAPILAAWIAGGGTPEGLVSLAQKCRELANVLTGRPGGMRMDATQQQDEGPPFAPPESYAEPQGNVRPGVPFDDDIPF